MANHTEAQTIEDLPVYTGYETATTLRVIDNDPTMIEAQDDWTVLHHTRGEVNDDHPYGAHMLPYELKGGDTIDLSQWEEVCTISGPAVAGGEMLFRLTNNVDESWSRKFPGSLEDNNGGWDMQLIKPLEIDENGKTWGHKSTSKHDIYRCNKTGKHYLLQGYGFASLY